MEKIEPQPLKGERYSGTLTCKGQSFPATFKLLVGPNARLCFDFDPVSARAYCVLAEAFGQPGEMVGEFSLIGRSQDGKCFSSDRMKLTSWRSSDVNGFELFATAISATISGSLDKAPRKPLLRFWVRSFRSLFNPPVETPLGILQVRGGDGNTETDDLSGFVEISAPNDRVDPDWRARAGEFLRHMVNGLALVHGARLETARIDYFDGHIAEVTYSLGSGFPPEFSILYHHNHGPFINALVARYFRNGPLPNAFWTALGWMQVDTTYDEVRFLTAMTALETIIECELPARKGTMIPKSDYLLMRKKIDDVIIGDETLSSEAQEFFLNKVAGLNKKTFSEKIMALFECYNISKRNFDKKTILGLIRLRNDIVHKGVVTNYDAIWPSIILARELITRILLNEINFRGQYYCYIGGAHIREFPDEPCDG
jgi:hypothetical protein